MIYKNTMVTEILLNEGDIKKTIIQNSTMVTEILLNEGDIKKTIIQNSTMVTEILLNEGDIKKTIIQNSTMVTEIYGDWWRLMEIDGDIRTNLENRYRRYCSRDMKSLWHRYQQNNRNRDTKIMWQEISTKNGKEIWKKCNRQKMKK